MKSCPKCNRTFPDEGQKFCTFDGGLLIAPQTLDPNATIRATTIDLNAGMERPTSRELPDPNATIIESQQATVALPRTTGPTASSTADMSNPPVPPVTAPPPPPPPPVEPKINTAEVVAPPPAPASASAPLPPAVPKKKSKMPWIIAGLLLFFLLGGGVLVGAFFFVIKPWMDQMAAVRNIDQPAENTNLSTPTPASTVEAPSPTPEDTFQPPAGAVQFANSSDNLDGKLAEHYFDFSFYYPESWTRDAKAGVPGATNFVGVVRSLTLDFPQESFAVGWYTST